MSLVNLRVLHGVSWSQMSASGLGLDRLQRLESSAVALLGATVFATHADLVSALAMVTLMLIILGTVATSTATFKAAIEALEAMAQGRYRDALR